MGLGIPRLHLRVHYRCTRSKMVETRKLGRLYNEAYGKGGEIVDDTFAFTKSNNDSGNITLSLDQNNGSGASYTPNIVNNAGFTYGQTYFHETDVRGALDPNYQLTYTGDRSFGTYEHQQSTIENVVPGSYRADYDVNPDSPVKPKSQLSMNYTPQDSIKQMVFSLDSSGGISLVPNQRMWLFRRGYFRSGGFR